MSEVFWPSVAAALAVVAVTVPVMWLVAVFAAKVLRWPSARTVRRWERAEERNPNADGPMTPMLWAVLVLGLVLPVQAGFWIDLSFRAPTDRPEYTGQVVEAGPCVHGPLELWWLYRCDAVVEVTDGPLRSSPEPPQPPEGPVRVELLAREPVVAGSVVGLQTGFDDDGDVERRWGLLSEADRPGLAWGVIAGAAAAFALSFPVGLWWRRARPRPSPFVVSRPASARRHPVPSAGEGVEAGGYALWLVVPLVLAAVAAGMLGTFLLIGHGGLGRNQIAAAVALLASVPAVAAGGFKLRLAYDRSAKVLSVTRRFWFGPSRRWEIPLTELDRWYYVKDTQSLVLRRHGNKPLSFILFMGNDGPERLVSWAEAVLPRHHDAATGSRVSERARRALVLGFGLGIPLLGVLAFVVLLTIYGA